jgi:hypothetical protein
VAVGAEDGLAFVFVLHAVAKRLQAGFVEFNRAWQVAGGNGYVVNHDALLSNNERSS